MFKARVVHCIYNNVYDVPRACVAGRRDTITVVLYYILDLRVSDVYVSMRAEGDDVCVGVFQMQFAGRV